MTSARATSALGAARRCAALLLAALCACGSEADDPVGPPAPAAKRRAPSAAREQTVAGTYPVDRYESAQAAIAAAAAAGGGTVVFGARVYDLDATLVVDHLNVRLRGEGRATVLRPARELVPMIYVGADSGPFFPYSGNAIADLTIDFAGTDSTAIFWRRWGQIGTATNVHFANPGTGAVGIETGTNRQVNELVFEGINWWHDVAAAGGDEPDHRGTAIRVNANNCKVQNSTIIGAAVAVDVGAGNAISAFSLSGCRLKENGIGIRFGGGARRGGFAGNVSDTRFEKNSEWDVHIAGESTTYRWDGVFLRGLFFSNSAGIFVANTAGVAIDTVVVKDFTRESTRGRDAFVSDGSRGDPSNAQFHARNVVRSHGTTIARLLDERLAHADADRAAAALHLSGPLLIDEGVLGLRPRTAPPAPLPDVAQVFYDARAGALALVLPDGSVVPFAARTRKTR